MNRDFENNEIYKYLIDKNNSNLVSIINTTYDNCEYILGEITKEFSNYTIHDIHHSIRVINYMTEFVKPNIHEYSDFHLALILLVGLLHDTGMFVSDEEKTRILETEIPIDIDEKLRKERFQDYIRMRHSRRVRKIIDNYIIDQETNSKFSGIFRIDTYNFSDDVYMICQSHTESLEWIIDNINDDEVLAEYHFNPQQIALLLKLGDNLDIDGRRAPYSLLNLLGIKGFSENEWRKHSPIKNYDKVEYKNNCFHIYFTGKCDNPFIYRNVMEHVLWLEKTCSQISSILANYHAPYNLNIDKTIRKDIKTIGFIATDLHFHLDYSSVLKLLMGEQLYGDKRAGLRELLQNSIDAIMVMHEKLSNISTTNYRPTIWIELNKAKNTISVCDNGIGMSNSVLKNYFFNIGKSYYTSEDYKMLKLNYSAIGHFGIGFLACFMLSSNVLLETKTIDQDPIVVEFERMSQFVTELTIPSCVFEEGHGTRIHLSYDEIIPSVFEDEDDLKKYVRKMLLIKNFAVKIIDSNQETIIIENTPHNAARHICTDKIDLHYTLSQNLDFWHDFSDVWGRYGVVHLCCHCDDFDNSSTSFLVDLHELDRVLNMLASISSDGNLIENINSIQNDESIQLFLSKMYHKNDTVKNLRERINQFIFSKAYNSDDECIEHRIVETDLYSNNNYWDEDEWFERNHSSAIVLIDFRYGDSPKIINDNTFENTIDNKNTIYDNSRINYLIHNDYSRLIFRTEMIDVVKSDDAFVFLPLERHDYMFGFDIYMHGILVTDEDMEFAYSAYNTDDYIKVLMVNVKSDEYELVLSRKKFNYQSLENLTFEIAKLFYKDLLNNPENNYTDNERSAILNLVDKLDSHLLFL